MDRACLLLDAESYSRADPNARAQSGIRHAALVIGLRSLVCRTAVANYHDVNAEDYKRLRCQAPGRDMAAWLCRKWTGATLRTLGPHFGLEGVDSVSNLVRRAEQRYTESRKWKHSAKQIEAILRLNTEHKA